jgi:hypothetical protein
MGSHRPVLADGCHKVASTAALYHGGDELLAVFLALVALSIHHCVLFLPSITLSLDEYAGLSRHARLLQVGTAEINSEDALNQPAHHLSITLGKDSEWCCD